LIARSEAVALAKHLRDPLARLARFVGPTSTLPNLHVLDEVLPKLDALRADRDADGLDGAERGVGVLALRHHAWYAATAVVFQRDTPELDALNDRLNALMGERLGDVQYPPNYSEWFDNRHSRCAALVRKDEGETMRAIGRSFAEILGGETAEVAPVAEKLHQRTFFRMVRLCRAARSDQPSGTPAA
jgi:hypothetical protein